MDLSSDPLPSFCVDDVPKMPDISIDSLTSSDGLDDILHYLTGSTPSYVCKKLINTISELHYTDAAKFIDAAVLACSSHRQAVEDHISKPGNEELHAYLLKHFNIQNRINFTEINLLGHCFLAAGVASTGTVIPAVRRRIGGDHMWSIDSSMCKLSKDYYSKDIAFTYEEASLHGKDALSAIEARRATARS